jgi:adenylate cyclase
MFRLSRALILGLIISFAGLMFSYLFFAHKIEEKIDLDILFKLRGSREPPPEVIIVSLDKSSADILNVSHSADEWPRSLHARLTNTLVKAGASVIIFDLIFSETRNKHDDTLFAQAINNSQRVILCSSIKIDTLPVQRFPAGFANIEILEQPIPILAQAAIASVPFPIPKVPVKVNQYWTFKTSAGDIPTLPITALHIFANEEHGNFLQLMKMINPSHITKIPNNRELPFPRKNVVQSIHALRETFVNNPALAEKMIKKLDHEDSLSVNGKENQILRSLIKMYQSPNIHYLNFYGPPQTITTVPYHEVLQSSDKSSIQQKHIDFNGKVVFVGSSEKQLQYQKDGYYTVYSQSSGLDISGVEIAATAFANLLEDKHVKPLSHTAHIALILFWGLLIGFLCYYLPPLFAAISCLGISAVYLFVSAYQFKTAAVWYPLSIYVFFQTPLAFFSALVWKYTESKKEHQNIRKAFSYYLPDNVVDQLSKNILGAHIDNQVVYGTCLSTDLENYTELAETMEPKELSNFMNSYYEAVFAPVKQYGGIISNVVADSMLALWISLYPEEESRKQTCQACHAAFDITRAVHKFKQSLNLTKHQKLQLKTRIGMHSGNMALGNIGALDHYEYRPIGDIVNTATRIEGLNKALGTHILVSESGLHNLEEILTREMGTFLLKGKTKPVAIYELICHMGESTDLQRNTCVLFSKALDAFKRQSWQEAIEIFYALIEQNKYDRPSRFYIEICIQYSKNPPGKSWDGVIIMDKK